jgi:hypothetical protein
LQQATVQALLNAMTPEVKAQLIENAIKNLLTPSTNSWENKKTPIESVFEGAATQVVREEAARLFKEDEAVRDKVVGLMRRVADKMLGDDVDSFATRIAEAMIVNIRNR